MFGFGSSWSDGIGIERTYLDQIDRTRLEIAYRSRGGQLILVEEFAFEMLSSRRGIWPALGFVALTAVAAAHDQFQAPLAGPAKKPNIVFFLTDDQDVQLDSVSYQPLLKKYLIDEGLKYEHHFCTVALCCPSRVNLWTGKAAHNTNVTDVNPPHGGYPKFISQGLNDKYLPVWLQNAEYDAYYTGKLFNSHNVDNYATPFPAGFTGSDFLLDPYTYRYLNSTWQRNQDPPISYEGQYTTDVIATKALGFLNEAAESDKPFFLAIAPVAPHSNVEFNGNNLSDAGSLLRVTPPIAAERHKHLFKDVKVPRTPNFNPDSPSGVSWIRELPQQNQSQLDYNDEFYRSRLRALQAVDELIETVVNTLEERGILDNTYIIYTADNGYHIGQHRLPPGKECGYEEDVNVPLVVRGPGIPRNRTVDQVTSHTDLVPTIFKLLGLDPHEDFDGVSIPLTHADLEADVSTRHEHITLEYWGFALAEGQYGFDGSSGGDRSSSFRWNNTYKAVRVVSEKYNLYYSVWCSNEHELYDLSVDPYQLHNLYTTADAPLTNTDIRLNSTISGFPIEKVASRLDALLLVLKSCRGITCIKPWDVLHPAGNVRKLNDALESEYDEFYEEAQRKVEFSRCETGYILDAEGPQEALVYRDGLRWSEWT
ncbi:hypothetical protein MMC25_005024 [Agyrium rufum]|nr:hypothetical protein [Agyrium rufum]